MDLHRAFAQPQMPGNFLVGPALDEQFQHLALARRQVAENSGRRRVEGVLQRGGCCGRGATLRQGRRHVDDAVQNRADRLGQFGNTDALRDEAVRAGVERRQDVRSPRGGGDDDAHVRKVFADDGKMRRLVHPGHVEVEQGDGDIGIFGQALERLVQRRRFDDLGDPHPLAQDRPDRDAKEFVIIGHQSCFGSTNTVHLLFRDAT